MSDHETTLREMADTRRMLVATESQAAACLAGADALRRGTCGTCLYRIAADRNCQLLVMPVEFGQATRPGDVNFGCAFYESTEPTR